jgi:hypothetical protein
LAIVVAAVAYCPSMMERLELLPGMVGKTVVNPRVMLEMSESEEKIDGSDYHVREMCAAER